MTNKENYDFIDHVVHLTISAEDRLLNEHGGEYSRLQEDGIDSNEYYRIITERVISILKKNKNYMQEEPVSEGKMTISKEWFEHCKKSWYNEGYIDGEYNRDRQFEEPVSDDLGEFINELSKQFPEVSFAKVCKIATRTAKWLMLNSKLEENV